MIMPNAHPDLWQRYQATKAASTAKYARDIAAEMGDQRSRADRRPPRP
ncbi:hypothetical protein LNP17_24480 [Klebsiella variicola subsp. variicola]|nr:hypothetical protein [Klebsiella variicola subsp. variicola]